MAESEKEEQYQIVPTREPNKESIPEIPLTYGIGYRHVQAVLLLFSLAVAYAARAHVGLTVVAMSKHQNTANTTTTRSYFNESVFMNDTDVSDTTPEYKNTNSTGTEMNETVSETIQTFEWPKSTQEMILDSFFLGYFLMMFPMGMIAQRFGGKLPLQICMLVNGLVSIAIPALASWGGWKIVCLCRVLQGLSQSGLYPSVQTILSAWAPISERATLSSYIYTGSTIGTVMAFQSSGVLASSFLGWPSTFWLFGAVCIGAFILLTLFTSSTPSDHKRISKREKTFIMGRVDEGIKKKTKTPWKQILTSRHVWGAFIAHATTGVCFIFLFTQIPTYLFYILGFNMKESGILSSLPYIASIILSISYGIASDYFTNRGLATFKTARVACNTLAQVGPALCLVTVTFTDNNIVAVILLVLGVGLLAGVHVGWMFMVLMSAAFIEHAIKPYGTTTTEYCGISIYLTSSLHFMFRVNYIDLTPNFSGSLMAFGNTMSALGSLAQPFIISNIVTDVKNRSQWRIVMFLMASLIFIGSGIFAWFVSTEVQPWDQIDYKETEDPGKEKQQERECK